ncbi:prolyl oligopeptidase family serine peptidase [Nocardioides sp.]|uniref:prolyl oligopeptidase family serine peptidase n=1 Tax=Nocardioides sp. TaxID=35761 RepID=UPI002733A0F5|nr:prolyl oligopeptidase family serine peptidase [Nocardioides sp.]MDP3889691.1 prolyl oligopeptidase family serine peptidase [Nocardioides sp.]
MRPDPWFWLHDTSSSDVVAHLTAEQAFYDASCAHLHSLRSELGSEMVGRLSSVERSPAWQRVRFFYYTEHPAGSEYAVLHRRNRLDFPHSETISGQVQDFANDFRSEPVMDFGSLADGSGYLDLGLTQVSPDENLLAYSVDTVGDEVYRLRFRDLRTGEDLAEEIPRTYYGGAWSADSAHFFYTVHDHAYRPHQVWRHRLGTSPDQDELVLEEPDEAFALHLRASRSGDLVIVLSESRSTGETWVLDAHDPAAGPRSVGGRRAGVVYHVEHVRGAEGSGGGRLLVVTNDGAQEFRLMGAPLPGAGGQAATEWHELRPEDPAERLERVDAFEGHVVLSVRSEAEHRLRLLPLDELAGDGVVVRSRFPGGAVHLGRNTDYAATSVLVTDRAHVEPETWVQVGLDTGKEVEVGRREAPGHDPGRYVTERHTITAPDGTGVPVTLVRHRDVALDGTAPALLYGYGAYEYTFEPDFDPALPSLLDRGVVYAHVHVRGGGEGGRRWWLEGRLEHKQNTFTDYLAAADALDGLVDGTRLATRGLSAGGLLQGAVLSQRPERWRAVVAEVPFVDVVTSMLDASIPLTVNEWEEWGDPSRPADHAWMLAYSPYDNLPPAGGRPDLLVTGALHDPRVMVHEPAKWVAALRDSDPEWGPRCLFRCEVGAGAHAGPSGRFGHLAYEAEIYAWVLDRLGVAR